MGTIEIREVTTKRDIKQFINLGYKIYKDDKNWIPFLKMDLFKTIKGKNNPLFAAGPYKIILAFKDKEFVGRLLFGIDNKDNAKHNKLTGYFSLFECINNQNVANTMFNYMIEWMNSNNIKNVIGPLSPTKGDDYRGFLTTGFEYEPALMNSHNPKYYLNLVETFGFSKDTELLAYQIKSSNFPAKRYEKVINYGMRKYHFHVDCVDLKKVKSEIKDIIEILKQTIPNEWNMSVPSEADIYKAYKGLKMFIDPNLVLIARKNETNKPIGLVLAVPDYNQVIKKINGKLIPFGWIKYFLYKKKINQIRVFAQYVIPEYQGKGINAAIFYKMFKYANEVGFISADGSTIGTENAKSYRSLEDIGGKIYRRYNIYKKEIVGEHNE